MYVHSYSVTLNFSVQSYEEDGSDALLVNRLDVAEVLNKKLDQLLAEKRMNSIDLEDTVEIDCD